MKEALASLCRDVYLVARGHRNLAWMWGSLTYRFRSEHRRVRMWAEECASAMLQGMQTALNNGAAKSGAEGLAWSLENRPQWKRTGRLTFSFEFSIEGLILQQMANEIPAGTPVILGVRLTVDEQMGGTASRPVSIEGLSMRQVVERVIRTEFEVMFFGRRPEQRDLMVGLGIDAIAEYYRRVGAIALAETPLS